MTFLHYIVLAYMRYRVSLFEIHSSGTEYLAEVDGKSYILVANHILERDTMLKILRLKGFDRFNHAIDSFALQQVVREHTGKWVRVVAKYGRDSWYSSLPLRLVQRYIRQPLTQGQLEGVGYVPVDLKTGVVNKDFMRTVDDLVRMDESLLIFPEGNSFADFEEDRSLRYGAAHLARKYGIPILPAYIAGCDTWQPGNRVDIWFGPPVVTAGLSKNQIVQQVKRAIVALRPTGSAEAATMSR